MTAKLIKWVIPGLMLVVDVGAVAANELEDSIIPQLGMESGTENNSALDEALIKVEQENTSKPTPSPVTEMINQSEDDQGESTSDTESLDDENSEAKKSRFGIGYEYRRNHRAERIDRPQRPERPQRIDRPQKPDRPGRFGW